MPSSLPMLGLLAFTAAASCFEIARRPIPDRLVGLGLVCGLVLHPLASSTPLAALGLSLAAVALGAAVAVPLWRLGALGGGDVKLLAACGAFVTPLSMLGVLGHALLVFGLFAASLLAFERRLGEALVASTRFILGYPPEAAVQGGRIPYFAPALLAGAVLTWSS